jgi:hypothetical protein
MINLSKNEVENLYPKNQLEPPPNQINTDSGLCMWEVKSIKDDCIYRIWANSYKEALQMLPQIESF